MCLYIVYLGKMCVIESGTCESVVCDKKDEG